MSRPACARSGTTRSAKEEAAVLNQWLKLEGEIASLKKQVREQEDELDAKALAKYPKFTDTEIKSLVVDDKWSSALDAAIHGEMDHISQALTQRVKQLAERYENALPEMTKTVALLEAKVCGHLRSMGFQ